MPKILRSRLWMIMLVGAVMACNLGAIPPTPTALLPTATIFIAQPTSAPSATPFVPVGTSTPLPTAAPPCYPRNDWPTLTVAAGDTLQKIAQRVGTSVADLTAAN